MKIFKKAGVSYWIDNLKHLVFSFLNAGLPPSLVHIQRRSLAAGPASLNQLQGDKGLLSRAASPAAGLIPGGSQSLVFRGGATVRIILNRSLS